MLVGPPGPKVTCLTSPAGQAEVGVSPSPSVQTAELPSNHGATRTTAATPAGVVDHELLVLVRQESPLRYVSLRTVMNP